MFHLCSDCLSLKYSHKHIDEAVNTLQKNHKHKGRQETQGKRMKDMIQLDVQLTSYPYRIWATSSKILLSHHLFLSFYSLCPSKPQNKWWNSSFQERQWNLEIREQSQTNTLQSRYDQNQGYMEKTWEIWKCSAYNQMDWEEVWYSEKDQNLPKLLQSKCCNQERNVNEGWGEDLGEIKRYQKKRGRI